MAPSALSAALRAGALGVAALAVSKPEGLRLGRVAEDSRLPKPWPADLARWAAPSFLDKAQASGPLFSETSEFQRAEVRSLVGDYNLTIAAYEKWTDQGVSGELLGGRGWETSHIADLCKRYLKFGAVGNFLDVGANIGTFTIPMADCLQSHGGRVIAVEGMPPTADHLAVGILRNKLENVDMYNYAVGAPGDETKVTMSLNPVNKGGSTVKGNKPFTEMSDDQLQDLFHPGKAYAPKVVVLEFDVPLTTGDKILENNPAMKAISFAKVDIEGHEGHFIKGSQLLFSEFPPCILTIELIEDWLERAGTPAGEILDLLAGWGYKNVPTAAELKKRGTQGHTLTIHQKRMGACLNRVRSFAQA
mmetsp:Transcript_19571/g.51931  ORF Transcript_19571/g.51931 Transcript_19571/m.51931 type:complete len:361 (+) Transcript_19571:71-1153(+)